MERAEHPHQESKVLNRDKGEIHHIIKNILKINLLSNLITSPILLSLTLIFPVFT